MGQPQGMSWPGRDWNKFAKDYWGEVGKHFMDPVTGQLDQGRLRRFFGGTPK
jgi:hypothetical protein